ncbi:protein PHYTOCHROME KINASE SUBSTRATE 1-like [Benincasa hispida]|uniref:protein PHYTOCHROME KINASE SUBSTRATE 1-like n=1 Tax=Benincasa hispida TaxID=102211 RepID=UPI001901963E|nr:protein PHYTOCHROME KINASE SUBSTRATE 1-like [Benincasa hispida]
MDIFSSISTKTLPFDTHIDNNNNNIGVYGDPSSYKEDHTFIIHKLTESTRYLKSSNTIPGSGGHEDGEIGIFGAEKYFNGGIENDGTRTERSAQKLDKLLVLAAHQQHNLLEESLKLPKPRLGTPSVGSESSSINSQRPLLNVVKNSTTIANNNYSLQKRSSSSNHNKSFLSNTFGYCMCCSSSEKSAVEDVGEISFSNAVTTKPTRSNNNNNNNNNIFERETPSFRGFPTAASSSSLKMIHFQEPEEVGERKSLEVFGSPVMGRLRNNKPISLEKRLAMLSWDHTNNNNNSLGSGVFYNEDEVNSDCSSDLFEIESLTKQTNPFHSPTASCYAPSEASVDWSVVTASALDFDERRLSTTSPTRVVAPSLPMRVNVNKEVVQKRRPSSILGCKSEKAVRVAEDNNKYGRKMNGKSNYCDYNSESLVAVKRSEDETKVGGLSFRSQGSSASLLPLPPPPHRALATRPLPRPYSPRLTNISFNIQ